MGKKQRDIFLDFKQQFCGGAIACDPTILDTAKRMIAAGAKPEQVRVYIQTCSEQANFPVGALVFELDLDALVYTFDRDLYEEFVDKKRKFRKELAYDFVIQDEEDPLEDDAIKVYAIVIPEMLELIEDQISDELIWITYEAVEMLQGAFQAQKFLKYGYNF